jgi:hypothetical protein
VTKSELSPVQTIIGTLYRESMTATGHSWTRLNGALSGTMTNLIVAGVAFTPDDVSDALSGRNAGRWSNLERWYSVACGSEHSDGGGNRSAAISLEKYLGRSPFIWAERTKTPQRLYVGAVFTWKGERVTVTSFDDAKKTLTACSYTDESYDCDDQVGSIDLAFGEYRVIEARKDYEDGSIAARFSAKQVFDRRKIKKRFCISNEEMQTVRADYDARRRKHEKAIKAATTLDELQTAQDAATAEGASAYRHFDLEILSALVQARREAFPREEAEKKQREKDAAALAEWIAGADVRPYFSGVIRLRVKGDFVECSNGNKVSLESALKTLPLVHRCREKGWQRNGTVHDIDAFRLERIDKQGVTIGCTVIPWEEVDRFTPVLKSARKANA